MKAGIVNMSVLMCFASMGLSQLTIAADGPLVDPSNQSQSEPGGRPTDESALRFASATPLGSNSNTVAILTAAGYKATSPVSYHVGGATINGLYTCRVGQRLFGTIFETSMGQANEAALETGVGHQVEILSKYIKSICNDAPSRSSEAYCTQSSNVVVEQRAVFAFDIKIEVPSSVQSGSQVSWYFKKFSQRFVVPNCSDKFGQ